MERWGGKAWLGQEIEDILTMYMALEEADRTIQFPGFDTESEGLAAEPYEGEHHRHSEFYRDHYTLKHWPAKSHGRHLTSYRKMIKVWKDMGEKRKLTRSEARRIILQIVEVK